MFSRTETGPQTSSPPERSGSGPVRANRIATIFIAVGLLWFVVLPVFAPELAEYLQQGAPAWLRSTGKPISPITRLRWLLTLVPTGMVVHQALFLRYVRSKQFPTRPSRLPNDLRTAPTKATRDVYFGTSAIALRYCLPGLMVAAVCATMLAAIQTPAAFAPKEVLQWSRWNDLLHGIQCGFTGAYLYVVLTLGYRTFRYDVSSGMAMWSAAMFVLGPALGGAVAYLLSGSTAPSDSVFTRDVVLIAAGMAPRQFATLLQSSAAKFTRTTPVSDRRLIPLSKIHGITEDIEQRLLEEGISDAFTLAYCDPWLLLRTTSFDRRQIAAWVDEALLAVALEKASELEALGISGAIDLAWYVWSGTDIKPVAQVAGLPVEIVQQAAARFSEDAQVRIVWSMYQTGSESEPDSGYIDDPEALARTRESVYRQIGSSLDKAFTSSQSTTASTSTPAQEVSSIQDTKTAAKASASSQGGSANGSSAGSSTITAVTQEATADRPKSPEAVKTERAANTSAAASSLDRGAASSNSSAVTSTTSNALGLGEGEAGVLPVAGSQPDQSTNERAQVSVPSQDIALGSPSTTTLPTPPLTSTPDEEAGTAAGSNGNAG